MEHGMQEQTPLPATESTEHASSTERPSPGETDAAEGCSIDEPPLSSGSFALELIQSQIRRLGKLQAEVLADRDPEPLHQLRVSLRRLRTALAQFTPALELPESVSERRIAAVARRTSLCRDLDVLGLRIQEQLLPRLPEKEQRSLEGAIKRLGQDRSQAFGTLVEALHSPRYLKLLERLNKWQKKPRFTPLGQQPLLPWLYDWQSPFSAGLFLHPGWTVEDPGAEALHALRKQIKRARYSLEHLERWCGPPVLAWIEDLRQAQDHLGELHDLQILNSSFVESEHLRKTPKMPALQAELEVQQQLHWLRWREQARRLYQDANRQSIHRELMELGRGEQSVG